MPKIVVATESDSIFDQVSAAVETSDTVLLRVSRGSDVASSISTNRPDITILDLQIGNMGGVAACINLRHEAEARRLPETKVILLLDRDVDAFIAQQSGADAWISKPIATRALARQVRELLSPAPTSL